nr:hypothetical protein [Tanacetum cinerariifolium]
MQTSINMCPKTHAPYATPLMSSELDDSVPRSPVHDRYKSGEGYHAVPHPYTITFMPPKPDLVFNDAPNASKTVPDVVNVESSLTSQARICLRHLDPMPLSLKIRLLTLKMNLRLAYVKPVEHTKPTENLRTDNQKSRGHKDSWNRKACFVCKSLNHLIKDCDYYVKQVVHKPMWNNALRVNHHHSTRMSHPHSNKDVVPIAVLTWLGLVSLNVAKPGFTDVPHTNVKRSPSPVQHVVNKAQSPIRRPINQRPAPNNSNFHKKVTTVKGNPHQALKDKSVIDSGCSRHMTGNISYLLDFEEINGGYVTFGGNPKDKVALISDGSSETTTERYMENYKNVSQDIRDQLNAEAEAVQIILTGIDNDIYSTVDACPNACEMWKAIERLKQGESINVQDLETNWYWEFRKFTSRDSESLESYYLRFYKMMNELVRNQCDSQELKTVSYHKLYDILKQHQNEVNEIRAERLARTANPLAHVAQQKLVYHPQNHPTHYTQNSLTRSQQAATRNKGKAIVNSPLPIYDQEPSMVAEEDEMSKDKEIDKLMALISLSFKKIYKPTNNNLRTSSKTKQADWRDDTNDESKDQELEAHYIRNDVEYASKVEIDCAKAKGDLFSYKMVFEKSSKVYTHKINDLNQMISDMKKELSAHQETISILSQAKEAQIKLYITRVDKELDKVIALEKKSRPQLKRNQIEDRVMLNNSQGKKQEVEDHRRNVKFSKNKTSVTACNDSLNAKTSNVNFVCATCGKCVLSEKHDMCVLKSRNGVNSRTNMPMVVPVSTREPKPSSTNLLQNPLGRQLLQCPPTKNLDKQLGSYMSMLVRHFTVSNTTFTLILLQLVEIILFIIDSGCSEHMTRNLKLLINFVEKFLGLNLNLFYVGQLCDADLEVAFRKSTCYMRDLKGNDRLTATSSQAWLWHHRLSHLNFNTINLLSKNDIVIGLPKLKFIKDHLCSSCSSLGGCLFGLGSAAIEDVGVLESINGKRYVLVIVDDYSKYTWTHFLRSKDETPEVLIDFLRLLQRGLQAQVRVVLTDKGTKFLNQTLHAYFAAEGIQCQTSVARTPEHNGEKGDECIFVGYSNQSRAYRVFNKRERVIMESIHVNFDELPQMASVHNSSDPAPTFQTMASVQISSDPAPQCQTMALELNSLSPGRKCQENVSHGDNTGTVEDKILVHKPLKNYARCTRCGYLVDGPNCQGCALLRQELEENLVTYSPDFQNSSEPSNASTNIVNAPRETYVVKQDNGSFVDKIIFRAPDSPNQFHCFHYKDVLRYGEACK